MTGKRGARPGGKVLGMSGELEACIHERALLHRCRDHCGELAVHASIAGPIQHSDDVARVARVERARGHRLRRRNVQQLEDAGAMRRGRGGAVVDLDRERNARARRPPTS